MSGFLFYLACALVTAIVAPYVVYVSAKLAAYGYYKGKSLFERDEKERKR